MSGLARDIVPKHDRQVTDERRACRADLQDKEFHKSPLSSLSGGTQCRHHRRGRQPSGEAAVESGLGGRALPISIRSCMTLQ